MQTQNRKVHDFINRETERKESKIFNSIFHEENDIMRKQIVITSIEKIFNYRISKHEMDIALSQIFKHHNTDLLEELLNDVKLEIYHLTDNSDVFNMNFNSDITTNRIIDLIS
jgi:hypothetical protein